jgi:hypothetical protein
MWFALQSVLERDEVQFDACSMMQGTHLGVDCPICGAPSHERMAVNNYRYFLCSNCSHLFIEKRCADAFGKEFYNSPDYKALEAQWPKAERITLFKNCVAEACRILGRDAINILDYGAGAADLKEKSQIAAGVTFYDPYFSPEHAFISDARSHYDCVVLTEVLEHVFDPIQTFKDISSFSGMCIATTLLSDFRFTLKYLIPDGGHVSIYSVKSICLAAEAAGMKHSIKFWPGQSEYYYHLFTR